MLCVGFATFAAFATFAPPLDSVRERSSWHCVMGEELWRSVAAAGTFAEHLLFFCLPHALHALHESDAFQTSLVCMCLRLRCQLPNAGVLMGVVVVVVGVVVAMVVGGGGARGGVLEVAVERCRDGARVDCIRRTDD